MARGRLMIRHWALAFVSAWLGWAAAINLPFLPEALPRAEALAWPLAILAGVLAIAVGLARALLTGGGGVAPAAVALALILLALAVRLSFLKAPTLALIGLRESLALLAAIYLGLAALTRWAVPR